MTRYLSCCVCGSDAGRHAQWHNRDTGYGICRGCIVWLRGRGTTEAEIRDLYGVEGVHFAAPEDVTAPTT